MMGSCIKNHLLLAAGLVHAAFSQERWNIKTVETIEGKIYTPTSSQPYSGVVFELDGKGSLLKEVTYVDGISTYFTEWYPNGQKREERNFRLNEKNGFRILWHQNGNKKQEESWKHGRKDGLWTAWYQDGQKKEEGIYRNDSLHEGLFTSWWPDGQKHMQGTFKDWGKDGMWTTWSERGEKLKEETYKSGDLIHTTVY